MKNVISKLPIAVILSLVTAGIIINPLLTGLIATIVPTTFFVGNKIIYKNKLSKLFAVDRKNHITQAIGINMFKLPFVKSKGDYFKTELINLLIEMEKNLNYSTQSQAIVLKGLKTLEKNGFVTDLNYSEMTYNSKFSEMINNLIVNLGTGNYSRLFKGSKKYNISFTRTDKDIDDFIIKTFLSKHYIPVIENGKLKKIKYSNNNSENINREENMELLDTLPPNEIDKKRKDLEEMQRQLLSIKDTEQEKQYIEDESIQSKTR